MSDLTSERRHVASSSLEPKRNLIRVVHSITELKAVLRRERARTDRSGLEFSLLTFTPNADESCAAVLDFLIEILQLRLRETDEIGWVADGQIGAVLTYTQPGSAVWLADEICNLLPAGLCVPNAKCTFIRLIPTRIRIKIRATLRIIITCGPARGAAVPQESLRSGRWKHYSSRRCPDGSG